MWEILEFLESQNEQPRVKNPRFPSESSFLIHFIRGLRIHGFREVGNKSYCFIQRFHIF